MKPFHHVLILFLLTAVSFDLRRAGNEWGLPLALEQDSKIPIQVEMLREGVENPTADREFNWYPLLLARTVTLLPAAKPLPVEAPLHKHLAAAGSIHLQTRAIVALLAVLAVPLTWLLARLVLPVGGAYLAAFLMATSLLHISFAQQSRPHAPSATFFLAAVLAAVWVRRRDGWLQHALAGATALLAVGCLQSGVLVLPALVVAYATRAGGLRRLLDGRVLIPIAGAAAAVWFFYPFVFAGGVEQSERVVDVGGHKIFLDQFNGAGFAITLRTLWSYDPTLLVLAVLAPVVALVRRPAHAGQAERRDALVVGAFALLYLVVFGLYERNYERFVIPLIPYLSCAAAWAVWNVVPKFRVPLAAVVLVLPLWGSTRLASVRSAPHTMERAGAWVEKNLSVTDDVVLTTLIDLPLCRRPEGMIYWGVPAATRGHYHLAWTRYQANLPPGHGPEPLYGLRWISTEMGRYMDDAAGFLAEQGGDYAVVEVFADNRVHRVGTDITEWFRANGELLVRISPDGDTQYSEHPFASQDETSVPTPHFTKRLLQAKGTGPVIEIFKLRP